MAYDYTEAPEQRGIELIPAGTIATVQLTIRPGGAGEDGLLKRSKDGDCEMLDCEFVVVDGPHAKRKLWEHMIIDRHDRRPRQGCRNLPREVAGDPRIRTRDQAGRHEPGGAQGPHRRARRFRRLALHRQDRNREGQPEKRRHRRELPRPQHDRGGHHARPQGLAPGRAGPRPAGPAAGDLRRCGAHRQAGVGVMTGAHGRHPDGLGPRRRMAAAGNRRRHRGCA